MADRRETPRTALTVSRWAALIVLAGIAGVWWAMRPATVAPQDLGPHDPDLGNGRTMFFASGCASCHATPGQDDRLRLGGGLGLASPFGTFYAPNISPDPKDGIGAWNEAQFVTAMRKGTSPDGRHYYPSFPYTSYQRMRTEDIRDLFAFLKTIAPVPGRAQDHALGFPYSLRSGLGFWKLLFLDGERFKPDAGRASDWNRGAYLVHGPGHCGECHSPRTVIGGIVESMRLAGGPNPEGKGWVPNISQQGLKNWSAKDIEYLLETGMTPDGDSVGSTMTAVVRNTAQLSPGDRAAISVYLKSLPAIAGPRRPTAK